jgi:sec-independent protein translocase protein TatB
MFDITSSKLLLLAIVALLVIGPKDLPALLRTVGKYMGIIKRQAAEFRAQFDEAMRESEFAQLKKEMESIQSETESTLRSAEQSVEQELASAQQDVDAALEDKPGAQPIAQDGAQEADTAALPAPEDEAKAGALNGAGHAAAEAGPEQTGEAQRAPEKSQA